MKGSSGLRRVTVPAPAVQRPPSPTDQETIESPAPEPAQTSARPLPAARIQTEPASVVQVAQDVPQVAPAPPDDPLANTKELTELADPVADVTPATVSVPQQPRGPVVGQNYVSGSPFEDCDATFYAGFDFLFLRPGFGNADALNVTSPGLPAAATQSTTKDFNYGFDFAPRAVAGVVFDNGYGMRFQFFQFDHGVGTSAESSALTNVVTPTLGSINLPISLAAGAGTGQELLASHSLLLNAYDLDFTRQIRIGATALSLAGGVRYVQMEQRYNVERVGGGVADGLLRFDHDFEGFGPSIAAEWQRPFGNGVAFYATGRGSVVFGSRNQTASVNDAGALMREDHRNQYGQMGIGEVGLGLQYSAGMVTARLGYEGQLWTDAGNATSATGNMGLQGLAIMIGIAR